mmetsp:Transcript_43007/g.97249  ORF Transcript_43007/g.97249 Transcript_43007/m.97249 type:complete len:610 (+) Transcript_43007:509-2338(+)
MWAVGIIQMLLGVGQFARLVRLIPQTVMTGFVNGLATIIFMAQLESFMVVDWQSSFDDFDANSDGFINEVEITDYLAGQNMASVSHVSSKCFKGADKNGDGVISFDEYQRPGLLLHDYGASHKVYRTLDQGATWTMLLLVIGGMLTVHFFPRITKSVPSSLVAIIVSCFVEHVIFRMALPEEYWTPTVGDMSAEGVNGGLPVFHVPECNLDSEAIGILAPTAISLALVGLIESILTLQLVDEIVEDSTDSAGRCTQECLAQGFANLASAMFQSMGGDAMIGQSTINVKSGGIGRLSTTFAAVMFFAFILVLSTVIELVPISALTGILFMVVIYTFDWSCLPLMIGVDVERALGDLTGKPKEPDTPKSRDSTEPGTPKSRDLLEEAKSEYEIEDFSASSTMLIDSIRSIEPIRNGRASEAVRHRQNRPSKDPLSALASIEEGNSSNWKKAPGKARWEDSFIICLVTLVTVFTNLAVAVIVGVIISALFFAWEIGADINVTSTIDGSNIKTYTVTGPLFFASDRAFKNHFSSVVQDPPQVFIDLTGSSLRDLSALAALAWLGKKYSAAGKACTIRVASDRDLKLIKMFGRRLGSSDVVYVSGSELERQLDA